MGLEKDEICDVSDVLSESNSNDSQDLKPKKRPKRVLHFSDGDLEEYSDNETDTPDASKIVTHTDPKTLTWLPWTLYQTTWIGGKVLDGCDYLGECLASFFGITSPKYQFEINEFYRLKALENEMQLSQDLEMGGWNEQNRNNLINDNVVQ